MIYVMFSLPLTVPFHSIHEEVYDSLSGAKRKFYWY